LPRKSELTNEQLQSIFALRKDGFTELKIARQLYLTQSTVHRALAKQTGTESQQRLTEVIAGPTAIATRKSVFDTMARLEESLTLIEALTNEGGRLADKVSVLTERRMLIAEARQTLESIYNIRVLNDFISEVTAILESETPGSRERIYRKLEASTGANAATSLFATG